MNVNDRKTLAAIRVRISAIEDEATDLAEQLGSLRDGEQEKFDNLNESLQQSERGQAFENAANEIGEMADSLGELASACSDWTGTIDSLTEG